MSLANGDDLERLFKAAMARYPLAVSRATVLSTKPAKPVWKVETPSGCFLLKKLPLREDRVRFLVHAAGVLLERGVPVPAIVPIRNGRRWASVGDRHFILSEFIDGRKPRPEVPAELDHILRTMALFHRASKGLTVPPGSCALDYLGRWPEEFASRRGKLEGWRREVEAYEEKNSFDRLFLDHVETFLAQADLAMELLERFDYSDRVERSRGAPVLCHQDFAAGNLALDRHGVLHVFDLDSLAFDLPARDLRKILNKIMKKREAWDLGLMLRMLGAYQECHPLDAGELGLVAANVCFPELFYGQVAKRYEGRSEGWSWAKKVSKLETMIRTELSKMPVIEAFLERPEAGN